MAGATSALVERAVGHCLRRAPGALLSENVYDAAMQARWTLARGRRSRGFGFDDRISQMSPLFGSFGADAFAREISLSARRPAGFGGGAWYPRRGAADPPRATRGSAAVRSRSPRLGGADSENRSIINQSPNWPLARRGPRRPANDDDVVRAGNDLLDVQARHALRLREGWRTIESVADEFVAVAVSSVCERPEFLNETLDRALVNLALFATAELKGTAAKGLKEAPRKKGRGGRRVAGDGGSFGSRDFGETSLDEFLRGDPTAVTRRTRRRSRQSSLTDSRHRFDRDGGTSRMDKERR